MGSGACPLAADLTQAEGPSRTGPLSLPGCVPGGDPRYQGTEEVEDVFNKVLLAVDGSKGSRKAATIAGELAS